MEAEKERANALEIIRNVRNLLCIISVRGAADIHAMDLAIQGLDNLKKLLTAPPETRDEI